MTATEEFTHKNIKVNGINMHYVEQGNGPLLLLLHGFPEFWYSWRHQIPELAKHYHVVAPDLRGYNDTDKPPNVSDYKIETITKDILDLIGNLGYEKAIVVAHDWGGVVGYELGMKHPEKVEKLVILNSPHPAAMKRELFKNFAQLRRSWYMFFFQLPVLPEWFMGRDLRTTFYKAFRGWAYNKAAFSKEDIEAYVKAFEKKGALTAAINWYRAALREVLKKKKINPIAVSTLIIWGENDRALGKELTYDLEKYFTAPYRVEYLSPCSHWVQHDFPEKVSELILEFAEEKAQPTEN